MIQSMDLLGVRVAITNLQTASSFIFDCVKDKKKIYVCVAPVSTIVDCQSNSQYREVINGSALTTPDGMPLVWLGKLKGHQGIERTYGPDLMRKLCDEGRKEGLRHFFYGATDQCLGVLKKKLEQGYAGIRMVGCYAPPIRKAGEIEQKDVIEQINSAKPDILWVGLGSPKQDLWMADHRALLDVPVMIGVGAAFDFLAGVKPQAPEWMRRSGLEWFFRLCSEPKRLWRRYLIGNSLFIYLLCKDALKKLFLKGSC